MISASINYKYILSHSKSFPVIMIIPILIVPYPGKTIRVVFKKRFIKLREFSKWENFSNSRGDMG